MHPKLQKFTVSLNKDETPYYCRTEIVLDGKKVVFEPMEKCSVINETYGYLYASKTTKRPFVFGEISVTGDA